MAQIAAEVRKGNVKYPAQVRVSDMIVAMNEQPDASDWESQMHVSKAAYAAALGPKLKTIERN